ncbi:MAG: hypothetical protein ABSB49_13990 [Polyangia bacterium]
MALLASSHSVDIRSSTDCPSSQEIAQRLQPLLPDRPEQQYPADIASVDVTENGKTETRLRLHLIGPDGADVGDRTVLVQSDCTEAAATVAAVIAAWETEPLSMPVTTSPKASSDVASVTPSRWRVSAGAGGGLGLVGGVAAVGRIEALVGRGNSRLEARIGADSETARTISLSSGSVDWQHTSFEASVVLRTLHPMWPLSIDAGLALGWATLEGQGYSPDRQVRSFEYGACAAIRLARNLNRWALWAEVRTYGWAQEQRASLTGEIATTVLPRVDVTADVGLAVPLVW